MNELSIKLRGMPAGYVDITVDGAHPNFSVNQFGALETLHTTDSDTVEIVVRKYQELRGALWFLASMFFFVVSLFGIFDSRYDKTYLGFDVTFRVRLRGSGSLVLSFNSPVYRSDGTGFGGPALKLETELEVEQYNNEYYTDQLVKRRHKILRVAKIATWVGIVVIGIVCAFSLLT